MELQRSRQLLPRIEWVEQVGSTNDALRELAAGQGAGDVEAVPHGTVLATADQVSGRGRAGRGWQTPPGTALAMSVLIRGYGVSPSISLSASRLGPGDALPPSWLPLLAGSAVAAALRGLFPAELGLRVGTKWPNDVHVRDEKDAMAGRPGKKLCGILCEALGDGTYIAGMGLNLLVPEEELPTERATSVRAAGGDVGGAENLLDAAGQGLLDRVLSHTAAEMLALVELAQTNARAARIRVLRDSLTLGAEVRVHLPGGEVVDGRARELDEHGALVVDLPTGGQLTVTAADVEHLRSPSA